MNKLRTELEPLLAELRARYTADEVPPCRVCGECLSIQRAGGGEATLYGCSGLEDDPDTPGHLRMREGRSYADDHYSQSKWTQYRNGDSDVLALCAGVEGLLLRIESLAEARGLAMQALSAFGDTEEGVTTAYNILKDAVR
jgi:hypothetical protein